MQQKGRSRQRWKSKTAILILSKKNRQEGMSRYYRVLKTQRFGNWICFRPQVREDTYSVRSLRKS
jgi:hypothetical protein